MAIPGRTWRNPWLWPATQLGVLLLPLVTAWRIGVEVGSELDEVIAAELVVRWVSIWVVFCALTLGAAGELFVPRLLRHDPEAVLSAVSRRMLAVLLAVPASLFLVHPLDPLSPSAHWRDLGLVMATLAVPGWAGSLLARVRGRGPLAAVGLVVPWAALVFGSVWVLGGVVYLADVAATTTIAAAGVIGSIGLYLAAIERVTAPLGRVLTSVGVLATGLGAALTAWLGTPDVQMAWVAQPERVDPVSGAIIAVAYEPNLEARLLSITPDGAVERLPHGVVEVEFVRGQRLQAEPSPPLPLVPATVQLCAVSGEERRCVGTRLANQGVHVDLHGTKPQALMVSHHGILLWDLETDEAWQVRRPDDLVRWPCFDDGGGVMWRLRTTEGPYRQERLLLSELGPGSRSDPPDVSVKAAPLAIDHPYQCLEQHAVAPVGRFVRGRKLVGRPHTLFGPGLPEEGVDLGPLVDKALWSANGEAFMVALDPFHVRLYRPESGLGDVIEIVYMSSPELGPNGRYLAHHAGLLPDGTWRLHVRRVPSGEVILRTITESDRTRWIDDDSIIRVVEGTLVQLDVETGAETVLFPRPGQDGP